MIVTVAVTVTVMKITMTKKKTTMMKIVLIAVMGGKMITVMGIVIGIVASALLL
jgi:hypothetical protein